MIVGTSTGTTLGLLRWQWRKIVIFTLSATAITLARNQWEWSWLQINGAPLTIVGGAIAIFVGFRTNSAYDRWWEGRRLWGQLVNSSRMLVSQLLAYLEPGADGAPSELQRTLVRRHVAYVHVLRARLRDQDPWTDARVVELLTEAERTQLRTESSPNHVLLDTNLRALAGEARGQRLEELRLQALDKTMSTILDVQGGCERIKKTPMPRGYAFIADRLILVYGVVFPLALATDLHAWVVPLNVLVCLSFVLINETGRVLEDPFTMFWNGLPLSQLSAMIERDVRSRMGDTDCPPVPTVDANGILM
jgi:ion channel-forming bestrophin family protein